MFGVRLRSLFTSRWMAILWAILVCLTAIQFVGSGSDKNGPDKDAAAESVTPDQARAIANAF